MPAFLRLRWGRKALRLTATQYLLLLPTKVAKMKGRLPLTSIKIKSKVFRFKHLLHTWAQRFRWSKQLSEQPKSSLLISGLLFRYYELQGRETGSVASLSSHALTPGWSPQEARAVRRNVKPILLLQLQFVHLLNCCEHLFYRTRVRSLVMFVSN